MTPKDRLAVLEARLAQYAAAERAILHSQSYSMEGLTLTRANLETVRKAIAELEYQIEITERKLRGHIRPRLRVVVPTDALSLYRRRGVCRG